MHALPAGRRVVVPSFTASPADTVARGLRIEAQPAPAAPGPGEVIVAVRAAGVGWVDLVMASGQYQHVPTPPYTPGMEGAGDIVAVGPDVAATRLGERVLVDGLMVGPRAFAYQDQGTFASYVRIPSSAALPLPENLSYDEGACLLGAFETAYHVIVARGRIQPGECVLVHGASGATGLAAVQVAHLLGARVIATGRSARKLDVVRRHGADAVVVIPVDEAGGTLPFRDAVKAANGGRPVDVVVDGVGGAVAVESLRCLRFGGRLLVVGWASTPDVADGHGARGSPRANQLPTNLVLMKGLDVLGCPAAISVAVDPALRPPRLAQVLAWAASGAIRAHVSHAFPLGEVNAALEARWQGRVVGGCVIHPWAEGAP